MVEEDTHKDILIRTQRGEKKREEYRKVFGPKKGKHKSDGRIEKKDPRSLWRRVKKD